MYLLDTNVVAELRRKRPHGNVIFWLHSVDDADLYLSVVSVGEIQAGIEITRQQHQAKAVEIENWLEHVTRTFNILSMDARAFRCWARLMHGRSDDLMEDAMIAATAITNTVTIVTRNTRDLWRLGSRY